MGIPRTRVRNYPHEFSGGMRQRIMIALALALRPGVIVADEPTTALDVVVEAQILELLDRLRLEEQLGLILITHNLGIVAETRRPGRGDVRRPDRRGGPGGGGLRPAGPPVHAGPAARRSSAWRPPSCAASTATRPTSSTRPPGCRFRHALPVRVRTVRVDRPDAHRPRRRPAGRLPPPRRGGRLGRTGATVSAAEVPPRPVHGEPALVVDDLTVRFDLGGGLFSRSKAQVRAVDGVSFDVRRGEVFGLVGESGSGKTTLGRALLGLVPASSGSIRWQGTELVGLSERQLRPMRRRLAMVFQDPNASLNPAMTIGQGVGHPLRIHGITRNRRETRVRVAEMLERCGLTPPDRYLDVYPEDLSGGQKQRAVLARALITDPDLVVADEPVAALDMSVRAKVLDLLMQLREELDLTCLYITHDLASGKFVCDRLAIMYLGRFVEWGPSDPIYASPAAPVHPGAAGRPAPAGPEPQGPGEVAAARARSPTRCRRRPGARSTPAARRRSTRAAGRAVTSSTPSRPGGPAWTSRPSRPSRSSSAT